MDRQSQEPLCLLFQQIGPLRPQEIVTLLRLHNLRPLALSMKQIERPSPVIPNYTHRKELGRFRIQGFLSREHMRELRQLTCHLAGIRKEYLTRFHSQDQPKE